MLRLYVFFLSLTVCYSSCNEQKDTNGQSIEVKNTDSDVQVEDMEPRVADETILGEEDSESTSEASAPENQDPAVDSPPGPPLTAGIEIDVTHPPYNADPTGNISSHKALKLAFSEAVAGDTLYFPEGTYIIRPYGYKTKEVIRVPDGVDLKGAGRWNTILKFDASPIYEWQAKENGHHAGIVVGSNSLISQISIDGSADKVTWKNKGQPDNCMIFYGLKVDDYAKDSQFNWLKIHDIAGTPEKCESFGFMMGKDNRNLTLRKIDAFDNQGTGISINTDDPLQERGLANIKIYESRAYSNDYQGLTVYAAHGVEVVDFQGWNNSRIGLNVEWSRNLVVGSSSDCVENSHCSRVWDSGVHNLRVMGLSHVVVNKTEIYNTHKDGTAFSSIALQDGGYHRLVNNAEIRALPEYFKIQDTSSVSPQPGQRHLKIATKFEGLTHGEYSFPQRTIVNLYEAKDWIIFSSDGFTGNNSVQLLAPGLELWQLTERGKPVSISDFETWERSANIIDHGKACFDCKVDSPSGYFWKASQNASFIRSPYELDPGRKYLFSFKAKVEQANCDEFMNRWNVTIQDHTDPRIDARKFILGSCYKESGKWINVSGIVDTTSQKDNKFRIQIWYQRELDSQNNPSTLSLDQLAVRELNVE